MTPPASSFATSRPENDSIWSANSLKRHIAAQQMRGTALQGAKIEPYHQHVPIVEGKEPVEDFEGNYVFADIKESHTSRAMTSRYYKDMMDAAVSDVCLLYTSDAADE